MPHHGFLRVAAGCPELRAADPAFNADRTLDLLQRAEAQGVNLVVFPEMGLTGYTCHDLYHTLPLQHAAVAALGLGAPHQAEDAFGVVRTVGDPQHRAGGGDAEEAVAEHGAFSSLAGGHATQVGAGDRIHRYSNVAGAHALPQAAGLADALLWPVPVAGRGLSW